jgi:hypothetical protein
MLGRGNCPPPNFGFPGMGFPIGGGGGHFSPKDFGRTEFGSLHGMSMLPNRQARGHTSSSTHYHTALIKKKIKFSSYTVYTEIQTGAVAKSYKTISANIRNPFLIYDFAIVPV